MSRKIQITIVPRQIGDLIDQLIQDIISDFQKDPMIDQGKSLIDLIPNKYYQSYDLYQGKCYQQFTPNMCGYHAIYNTLCAVNMFSQSGGQYDIQSRSSFWKFKRRVQKFLFKMKKVNKLKDQWPWRQKDILDGDFQRTYNQVCIQYFNDFSIFRQHPDFQLLTGTWEFQYKNILGSNESKKDLQNKFDYFRSYKGKKPLLLCLMLAITTHWTSFIAIKDKGKTQFWFFDSFNNHNLDFTWQQIVEFIDQKNEERIKYGRPAMTNFQKETYIMCQSDTQLSLKAIIGCLKGTTSIQNYTYNQTFNIFGDHLQKAVQESSEQVEKVLRDYRHNIRSFFNSPIQWQILHEKNVRRMEMLFQKGNSMKNMHYEGKLFYSYLHKYKYKK